MSDNGSPPGMPQNLPLRGAKLQPYEGGSRVPLVVRWPDVVEPQSQTRQYVMIEDIFPAFLEMAGVTNYKQISGPIDGVIFVPLLKRSDNYPKNRSLYWHYPNTYFQTPYSAIRQGDWKLIYHHIDRRFEMFNLSSDLGERNNLTTKQLAVRRRLAAALARYLKQVDAQMPIDRSSGQSVPLPSGDAMTFPP